MALFRIFLIFELISMAPGPAQSPHPAFTSLKIFFRFSSKPNSSSIFESIAQRC